MWFILRRDIGLKRTGESKQTTDRIREDDWVIFGLLSKVVSGQIEASIGQPDSQQKGLWAFKSIGNSTRSCDMIFAFCYQGTSTVLR